MPRLVALLAGSDDAVNLDEAGGEWSMGELGMGFAGGAEALERR